MIDTVRLAAHSQQMGLYIDQYDMEAAQKEAEQIQAKALSMEVEELEELMPVLHSMVSNLSTERLEKMQFRTTLLKPILKSCRIFVELTWIKLWKESDDQPRQIMPTMQEKMFDMVEDTWQAIAGLPKRESADLRFELRCIEQSIKMLRPSISLWRTFSRYVQPFIACVIALQLGTATNALISLKQIVNNYKADMIASWYISVHHIRWLCQQIKTKIAFEDYIDPILKQYLGNEHKYATCISMILAEIVSDTNADEQLRSRAFFGSDSEKEVLNRIKLSLETPLLGNSDHPGLVHLLFCSPRRSLEQYKRQLGLQDSLWNTRHIAVQAMINLSADRSTYGRISKLALQSRFALLTRKNELSIADSQQISYAFAELRELKSKRSELHVQLRALTKLAKGSSRGSEERVEEISTELEDLDSSIEGKAQEVVQWEDAEEMLYLGDVLKTESSSG